MKPTVKQAIHFGISSDVGADFMFDGSREADYFHLMLKQRGYESDVFHSDVKSIKSMIQLGADGYILKNTEFDVLRKAVTTVLNGEQYFGTEVLAAIVNNFKPSVNLNGKKVNLSNREMGILELIADGLTTDAIAEKLFISRHTVNSHRRNLNVKLGVSRPAELINKAKELGII